jgi:hypothetical protein
MKIKFFLFSSICFSILSCEQPRFLQPYEMTVKVVDTNSKPLKGRKLNLIHGFEHSNHTFDKEVKDSLITDSNGSAVFKYTIESSGAFDIVPYVARITVTDDTKLVATNVLAHGLDWSTDKSKKTATIKVEDKIVMDSLIPFKIRIRTRKTNVIAFHLEVDGIWQYTKASRDIGRNFLNVGSQLPGILLDTTINTMVYSKTPMRLYNSVDYGDGTSARFSLNTVYASIYWGNPLIIDY